MTSIDNGSKQMNDRILSLTLRMMFLLTGEDYPVVKKTRDDPKTSNSRSRAKNSDTTRTTETNREILHLANQIVQLLTGEVPARCQDVAVYFSIEEWDYVRKHKDLYKDIDVDDKISSHGEQQILTPEHEINPPVNPTTMKSPTVTDRVSPDIKKEPMSPDSVDQDDCMGTAQGLLSCSECGEKEIKIEDPLNDWNPTSIKPLSSGDHVSTDLKQEAMSADSMDGDDCTGTAQESRSYSECGEQQILTLEHEINPPVNPTTMKSPTGTDRVSPDIKKEPMSPDTVVQDDCMGTALGPLLRSECGEQQILTLEHEINPPVNPTTMKSPTVTDRVSPDIKKEPMSPDSVDQDDCMGTAQGLLSCTECGEKEIKIEDPLNDWNPTSIKPPSSGDHVSTDLKQEAMSPDSMDGDDCTGTAQGSLSYSECGEEPLLTPKPEIEVEIEDHVITDLNTATLKSPTGGDRYLPGLKTQEPMSAASMDCHNCVTSAQEPFSCSECGKCFKFHSRLQAHQLVHSGDKPFSCPECGKCFARKSQLIQHSKIHTGEEQCSHCGKCFTQKSKLLQHERTHTGERPFSCPQCGRCFAQEATLTKHRRVHSGEKLFSCSECGKSFMLKSYLRCHQRTHTGEKPFACSDCEKVFTQKSHLSEHIKIHTGEKLFSCSECGKSFTQRSGLVLHQRLHTGEKPFSCLECNKSFIKKAQLVQHKRIHTEEEQCLVCGKCFTHKAKLIDHQRVHTGERPYGCQQCGKRFALKATLTRHKRLHTGEKLLGCSECGKSFMQKSDLYRHQRTHMGQPLQ